MKSSLMAFLFAFIRSILTSVGQNLWDGLWEQLFAAIEYAEEKWNEENMGEKKKEFVMDKALEYISKHTDLNFLYRKALEIFISRVIDGIVAAINEELGDDWVEKVKQYKEELAGFLDFIE